MQQENRVSRKLFAKVLPFLAGVVAVSAVLVACERPGARAEREVTQGDAHVAAPMNVEAPRQEPPSRIAAPMPPREALADTVITSRIKSEILGDPAMQGSDVSVNTDHGVVVLAGLVKTPEQTAVASAHAQRQDGVMRVDNHLATALQ